MLRDTRLTSFQPKFAVSSPRLGRHHLAFRPSAGLVRPTDTRFNAQRPEEPVKEERSISNLNISPESTSYDEPHAEVIKQKPMLKKFWQSFVKTATTGALCLALIAAAANPALAARSGGRVGGSAFSSGRGMGGPSISRSYGNAGAGLGGSMFGGSVAGPSLRGYSRSQYSVQGSSFGFFGPPAPWGMGGYGYGAPVAQSGGFGLGGILLFGILAAVLFSVFSGGGAGDFGDDVDEAVTVVKLQVGLLGSARQLKRDLERIAGRADTNTPDGLHYILQETVLSLLRNPDYAVYGAATTSKQRGMEKGESKFNRMSMEERGKIKEETLVNYDGRSRRSSYSGAGNSKGPGNDLIVITIMAAIDDRVNLPKVTSGEELREALNTLGSVGSEQVLACEVLWTPQDENDYYTRDDIIHDYPTLNNL